MTTASEWTSVARGWDSHRDQVEQMKAPLTAELLAGLALRPGEQVLELGAGTGELALLLADAVSPGGRVMATDVAPGMVELARRTTADRPAIDVREVDATSTGLESASFDAVVFRMGLMFVPEPAEALRECRRVLRPGGRAAMAVWSGPGQNMWLTAVGMSAMMQGLVQGGPPTGPGGIFSLGEPEQLEKAARDAGFADLEVRRIAISARYASADEHYDSVEQLAGPLHLALVSATPEQRAAVKASAASLIEQYATASGYQLPGEALLLLAH
ncbi:MAG: Methyltransferase type 11 [Frankiales bacterium]|nr:Methyltransferase type 11 [Frankiales bacterium]